MIERAKKPLEHRRSVLDEHIPRVRCDWAAGSKYPALIKYLAGEKDPARRRAVARLRARSLQVERAT